MRFLQPLLPRASVPRPRSHRLPHPLLRCPSAPLPSVVAALPFRTLLRRCRASPVGLCPARRLCHRPPPLLLHLTVVRGRETVSQRQLLLLVLHMDTRQQEAIAEEQGPEVEA